MMIPRVICPSCPTLILKQRVCPNCGWQRPVISVQPGQKIGGFRLTRPIGEQVIAPAISRTRICFPASRSYLETHLLETGKHLWSLKLPEGQEVVAVTAYKDYFVVNTQSTLEGARLGKVLLLEAESGQLHWEYDANAAHVSAGVISGTDLVFYASTGHLTSLRLEDKCLNWQVDFGAKVSWTAAAPLAHQGMFFLPGGSGFGKNTLLTAVRDGQVVWTRSAKEGSLSSPVLVGDWVVYRMGWKTLLGLEAARGNVVFKKTPGTISAGLAVFRRSLIIASTPEVHKHALSCYAPETDVLAWNRQSDAKILVTPVVMGERVYACNEDGELQAIAAESGVLCWTYQAQDYIRSKPVALGDSIWIATAAGEVSRLATHPADGEIWNLPPASEELAQVNPEMAAVAYCLIGKAQQAGECFLAAGMPREAAACFIESEQYDRAAKLLEQTGQLDTALVFYQKARHLQDVLRLAERLSRWQEAADLALALGLTESAAHAWRKSGKLGYASELFEQAGDEAERKLPRGDFSAQVADLYVLAIECSDEPFENERIQRLLRKIERHRRAPRICGSILPPKDVFLVNGRQYGCPIQIENIGWGDAYSFSFEANIQGVKPPITEQLPVERLGPGECWHGTVEFIPNPEITGPYVEIGGTLHYRNQLEPLRLTTHAPVAVSFEEGSKFQSMQTKDADTHIIANPGATINIRPDQRHDYVEVSSSSAKSQTINVVERAYCDQCGFPLKNFASKKNCPRCNTPFNDILD